ncbi:MAG: DUF6447 family protein [Desulfuromonadales bacterium]|nr:DUF6447 family protein [Desulfuromonadales bacterium]
MTENKQEMVTINGKDYALADLSDEVKAQINNIRTCEAEIGRLRALQAITETARGTYARALEAELAKIEPKISASN